LKQTSWGFNLCISILEGSAPGWVSILQLLWEFFEFFWDSMYTFTTVIFHVLKKNAQPKPKETNKKDGRKEAIT
jgi:hypothetical protein